MDPHILKQLNAERRARRACAVVTEMATGRDRLVKAGSAVPGALGEAVNKAIQSSRSGLVTLEQGEFFINAYAPPVRMIVIGAVHITQALVPMASAAGFDLIVIDPRTAFATAQRFEGCILDSRWPEEALVDHPLDAFTALAAVTHDPKIDDLPLMQALRADCFYVGALGSRKTHAKRLDRFKAAGITEAQIARLEAPIGLDIGAANPAEIAVSVMASVIAHLRGKQVSP